MDIHRLTRPIARHFRSKRMALFEREVDLTDCHIIVDVGGNTFNWQFVSKRPPVVLVNLAVEHFGADAAQAGFLRVVADGRALPFRDRGVDLVFCNSVIEHVGSVDLQRRFAFEIQRVARRFFVQTPAYSFPVEPHFLAPFFHYLPVTLRLRLARNFTPWGWLTRPPPPTARAMVREIRLLRTREFTEMFPGARLMIERSLGFPKSLIAVHGRLKDAYE